MTPVLKRQVTATFLAAALLALLLALASLDGLFLPQAPERVALREVAMYTPPPPPPPPPMTAQDSSRMAGPPLSLTNESLALDLQLMELDVSLPAGQFGSDGGGLGGEAGGMGVDWGTVNLSELDGYPNVESAPVMTWPEDILDSNIDQISVVFHIIIDETGRVYPVRVLENPFPVMNEQLMEYAARVRFSPPTRMGVPVRTQYRWPVLLTPN